MGTLPAERGPDAPDSERARPPQLPGVPRGDPPAGRSRSGRCCPDHVAGRSTSHHQHSERGRAFRIGAGGHEFCWVPRGGKGHQGHCHRGDRESQRPLAHLLAPNIPGPPHRPAALRPQRRSTQSCPCRGSKRSVARVGTGPRGQGPGPSDLLQTTVPGSGPSESWEKSGLHPSFIHPTHRRGPALPLAPGIRRRRVGQGQGPRPAGRGAKPASFWRRQARRRPSTGRQARPVGSGAAQTVSRARRPPGTGRETAPPPEAAPRGPRPHARRGTSRCPAHSCTPHPTPAPRESAGSSVGTSHFSGSNPKERVFARGFLPWRPSRAAPAMACPQAWVAGAGQTPAGRPPAQPLAAPSAAARHRRDPGPSLVVPRQTGHQAVLQSEGPGQGVASSQVTTRPPGGLGQVASPSSVGGRGGTPALTAPGGR